MITRGTPILGNPQMMSLVMLDSSIHYDSSNFDLGSTVQPFTIELPQLLVTMTILS